MSTQQHANAWRVPSNEDGVYGVVVQVDGGLPPSKPHWWVLCPAAATLILDALSPFDDCSLGIECDWDEVHGRARALVQRLGSLVPTQKGSGT